MTEKQIVSNESRPRYIGENRGKFYNESNLVTQVIDLAEPLCEAEGMELVHVEYQRESAGRILRLFLDKPEGVSLDDCVGISRQLSDLLDIYLIESEAEKKKAYRLEVSSPGIQRPLGKFTDFEKFTGKRVIIKTILPINGQKQFKGVLSGVSQEMIKLDCKKNKKNDKTIRIPYNEIIKARLIKMNGEF
ncbi:ribosome maturation factor RimP [Desulfococcaceae bacterium HSG7]|nr:ribosome maturation factor RimP [Desulfococcaceae bacterium HSG7]